MTAERWLPIPGYEGWYEASDQGRIRSVDRVVTDGRGRQLRQKSKVLSQADYQGYRKVALSQNGSLRTYAVHRLVMLTFDGPRPEGMEVHHRNNIRHDNRLENLEYVTPRRNTRESIKAGTFNFVAGHNRIQMPPEARQLLGTMSDRKLADRLGVSKYTVGRWRHQLGIPSYAERTGDNGQFRKGQPHPRWSRGGDATCRQ